jgi:hypothetical protein
MRALGFVLLTLLTAPVWAQSASTTPQQSTSKTETAATTQDTSAKPPAAKPDDVKSMDSIMAALYDVISGPAGQKRDWNRMRSLFIPGARLIPAGKREGGEVSARVLTVEDYVSRAQPLFDKEGFFESEAARRVEQYAHIAHVFSTYESRHEKGGKPFARGINSIQLLNDGNRWWIVTIYWEGETPETPLPDQYLHSSK